MEGHLKYKTHLKFFSKILLYKLSIKRALKISLKTWIYIQLPTFQYGHLQNKNLVKIKSVTTLNYW